jgi:sporulation integral membrane protein YtvI
MSSVMRRYLRNVLEVLALLVFVTIISWLFIKTLQYTMPFVLGLVIAIMLHPITKFLEKRGATRTVSIITSMILVIGLLIGAATILIAQIAQEANVLQSKLPSYIADWSNLFQQQFEKGKLYYGNLPQNVKENILKTSTSMLESIQNFGVSILQSIMGAISGLPETIIMIVIALIAAYFFLADRERIWRSILSISPPGWGNKLGHVVADVNRSFIGLIRAQIILVIVTMILAVFGLLIMGINYAVILGILLGVTGLIPIVGSGIVSFPWALYAAITGNIPLAIKLLILQGIISLVRHIIEPKILANNVGLDTLSTLIAMYVGMEAMGILGLFVGPIFVIAIKSLIKARMFIDFLPEQEEQKVEIEIVGGHDLHDNP